MSQTAIVINGDSICADGDTLSDANTNMVTKLNELISSTKPMETFNSQDTKPSVLTFPCDFDHMYASMNDGLSVSNENSECKHLKEFCLLHLDLIQQQSEIIAKQEKQLQSLRQENETLKLRLQRSDRRVGLNKTKDSDVSTLMPVSIDSPSSGASLSETVLVLGSSANLNRSHEMDNFESVDMQPTSPRSTLSASGERRRVARHSPSHWDTHAQQLKEDCRASVGSAGDFRDDAMSSTASQKSYLALNTQTDERAGPPQKSRRKQNRSVESKENSSNANQPVSSVIGRLSKKLKTKQTIPVLTTDTPYYTPMGDTEDLWFSEKLEEPELEKQVNGDMLEIPQWRLKTYTSVYSMEGTENLDDEVFLKRHQRLETDERRRKRWDVQRIREQRHIEKLRQRELSVGGASGGASGGSGGAGSEKGEQQISSLWPCVDDALYLEITDDLPVSAFGHPIAKFVPSTFSLPWLHGQTMRKSTPSTNNRFVNRRRTTSGVRRKRPSQSAGRQSFRPRPSLQRGSTSRNFFSGRRSEVGERK